MKLKSFFLTVMIILVSFGGCSKDSFVENDSDVIEKSATPWIKIAIVGGLTYIDPSLMKDCLIEGSDFMNAVTADNIIVELCKPVLDQAINQILAEKPDMLFITGALTFNGEKISHLVVSEILKNISKQGIKVFVIPGHSDINNPAAKAYDGMGSTTTPIITDEEFETIYKEFGYDHSISRDPNSLSYLTQASNKLWILGIDSRVYPIKLWGQIKPETLEWMKYWLEKARKNNTTVLALCHHPVTEAWNEVAIYGRGYVIKDHETVENVLTDAGLRVIFGAHANDITSFSKGENTLYNVSTEYLTSPPHAYRMIFMSPNFMKVETRYVTSVDADIPNGADFLEYTTACYQERMSAFMTQLLVNPPFNLPVGDSNTLGTAAYFGSHFAMALHSFYVGNEQFPPEEEAISQVWPEPFKHILKSIYTDLPPEDLEYTVDMRKKLR